VMSAAAMLAAKFKSGGLPSTSNEPAPDKNAIRSGQIRTFKIANLDAEQKRIQLELV
jgi:hypothetical protein